MKFLGMYTAQKSFTLVECLMVVIVIGVLAALAIPNYVRQKERVIVAEGIQTLKALLDAEVRFKVENGEYTSSLSDLDVEIPVSEYFGVAMVSSTLDEIVHIARINSSDSYGLAITENGRVYCSWEAMGGECAKTGCTKTGTLGGSSFSMFCN